MLQFFLGDSARSAESSCSTLRTVEMSRLSPSNHKYCRPLPRQYSLWKLSPKSCLYIKKHHSFHIYVAFQRTPTTLFLHELWNGGKKDWCRIAHCVQVYLMSCMEILIFCCLTNLAQLPFSLCTINANFWFECCRLWSNATKSTHSARGVLHFSTSLKNTEFGRLSDVSFPHWPGFCISRYASHGRNTKRTAADSPSS